MLSLDKQLKSLIGSTDESNHGPVKGLTSEEQSRSNRALLNSEDASLFGLLPFEKELVLAKCETCRGVYKLAAFSHHKKLCLRRAAEKQLRDEMNGQESRHSKAKSSVKMKARHQGEKVKKKINTTKPSSRSLAKGCSSGQTDFRDSTEVKLIMQQLEQAVANWSTLPQVSGKRPPLLGVNYVPLRKQGALQMPLTTGSKTTSFNSCLRQTEAYELGVHGIHKQQLTNGIPSAGESSYLATDSTQRQQPRVFRVQPHPGKHQRLLGATPITAVQRRPFSCQNAYKVTGGRSMPDLTFHRPFPHTS